MRVFCDGRARAEIQLTTPTEFLAAHPSQQIVRPTPSSWGEDGFNSVWLNEEAAWIYPPLHAATRRMTEVARRSRDTSDPAIERALRQAARELLLAQSSDWAFLIKTKSAPHYAKQRTEDHLARFQRLAENLDSGRVDGEFLGECEERANLFPNLNWRYYPFPRRGARGRSREMAHMQAHHMRFVSVRSILAHGFRQPC